MRSLPVGEKQEEEEEDEEEWAGCGDCYNRGAHARADRPRCRFRHHRWMKDGARAHTHSHTHTRDLRHNEDDVARNGTRHFVCLLLEDDLPPVLHASLDAYLRSGERGRGGRGGGGGERERESERERERVSE
jgi:hypothetical protein